MRSKAVRKSLWRALPWLFLAAVAALTLYMDVYVARNILDGDASDMLYRGYIIAKQRNPFTTDYYYTTEVSLLTNSAVFAVFFLFLDNWTLVRICGTITLQAMYVLSFLYLCRRGHLSWRVAVVSAAFLLLPFSTPYAWSVLYHLYYIHFLSTSFLMLGLTMRLMECRDWRKGILPGVALAALWVFVGVNGVRHMMILGAPMLVLAGVQLLRELRRYTWQRGRLAGERPFAQTPAARLTTITLASCICFLIGYAIYSKVLVNVFSVSDSSVIRFSPFKGADSYASILTSWLIAIGARISDLPLIGVRGAALAAALFSSGYLLWASGKGMGTQDASLTPPRLMRSIFLCSLIVNTLVFFLDCQTRVNAGYYSLVTAFTIPTLALELESFRERAVNAARKLMILLACACLLFQGGYTCRYMLGSYELDKWPSTADFHLVKTAREYADFIMETGYTHVIVPHWWYANTMMELSDGKVKTAPVHCDWEDGSLVARLNCWGTSKTAFAKENLPETLLLLSNDPELLNAGNQPKIELYHTFTYPNGSEVYLYTFPSQAFHLSNE